ncbi:hypothetical protein, partial [Paenisporosarcina sp. TG20]|uniref:hypothetical protein n=1 Tax=Paenisporosarcina sp. TG20 TaxID=1211706 RepID=UPI001ED8F33F
CHTTVAFLAFVPLCAPAGSCLSRFSRWSRRLSLQSFTFLKIDIDNNIVLKINKKSSYLVK